MNIDRTIAPQTEEISSFNLVEANSTKLENGINIHRIQAGNEAVLKVDFVFNAGSLNQSKKGQAALTNRMIGEGTSKYTAQQLADALDFYGAYINTRSATDESSVTLYCLNKHLNSCLTIIYEMFTDANFPEDDLKILTQNSVQKLAVNEQKNSFLVRKYFYASIFGEENPYGSSINKEDHLNINRQDLIDFYQTNYINKLEHILVSGQADDSTMIEIEAFCKKFNNTITRTILPFPTFNASPERKKFHNKPGSSQSAIRIGRPIFNRSHKDFRKFQLLNLILGGYFGSRLMKNIREDKGLTYGIYSSLESYKNGGCWYIETEMNNDLREKGLFEIYKELKTLREELIDDEELQTAKNYLLGSFLRSIDSPFSLADRYKILLDYNLEYSYYYEFIEIVKNTKAEEIRSLAKEYLQEADLYEIIVGS
jgi:predicted Zn-dependent peptidase